MIAGTLQVNGGPTISSSGISGLASLSLSTSLGVSGGPQISTSGISAAEVVAGVTSLTLSSGPALSSTGISTALAISGATTIEASTSIGIANGVKMTTAGLTTTATDGDLSIDPNGDGKTVVTGLFKLTPGSLASTCDSGSRGSLIFVTNAEGGAEDDALYLCARKSADQTYAVSFCVASKEQ